MIRLAHIRIMSGGRFELDPAGAEAIMLTVEGIVDDLMGMSIEPVDLVAWLPASPWRWALRFRTAPILGEVTLDRARFHGDAIALHATPERWCEAKGQGVCVLDWKVDLRPLFEKVSSVECDSDHLAKRLRAAFRAFEPAVKNCEARHAA